MEIRQLLEQKLSQIVSEIADERITAEVSLSSDLSKGDFTTNIALQLGKKLGNPMQTGEKIIGDLKKDELFKRFKRIELAAPGFINFYLSDDEVDHILDSLISFEKVDKNRKVIFEYGDPNPFKEPHIGHLRNFILGDSLIKLLESQGIEVIRASYQGDVGLHVAKTIWGLKKLGEGMISSGGLEEKVRFLGKAYQEGAKAYDENEDDKLEIDSINIKIYQNDPTLMELWKKGRQISLEHFEELYKTLGIKYDKYYFEKDVVIPGKKLVDEYTPKVFTLDNGATVYYGKNEGLHTRVFLNSDKNPTYEAKDLGLAYLKDKDFPDVNKSIIMTANEQVDYFKVVLKALEKIDKEIAAKTFHLAFGFVNLKDGKMSSRKGKVIPANWLLEEVRKSIKTQFKNVSDEVLEQISVGAVKWSMLKFSRESDMSFSIEESIDLTGNSGPYMQYTFARISSLLEKSKVKDFEANSVKNLPPELLALGRELCQFEIHLKSASESFQPNILTEYLFHLAQKINSIYEKEKIIGHQNEKEIVMLLITAKKILGSGLGLLGISTPEKI